MAKKSPYLTALERAAKGLAAGKSAKRYPLLIGAFDFFAAAGDVPRAEAVIRLIYDGVHPLPPQPVHALGTGPIDGFLRAVGRPDATGGRPLEDRFAQQVGLSDRTPAEERASIWEARVRGDLTRDAFGGLPPPASDWRTLDGKDLWRRAQALARPQPDGSLPKTESDALAALTKYLDVLSDDPSAFAHGLGSEIVLVLDLALRHGAPYARWLARFAPTVLDELQIERMLCLPVLAKAIAGGLFREVVGLTDAQSADVLARIEAAAGGAPAAAPKVAPGGSVKRTVSCDSSQFYLEHVDSKPSEAYFQDDREHAQGMSIFPGYVGIATPAETGECAVEVRVERQAPKELGVDAAVQAVSFPFKVHGPLVLRSLTSSAADEDSFDVAHGAYDVLATFRPAKGRRDDSLRKFAVTISFVPAGALQAPKCLKLEDGRALPKSVFVHEGG
jgi:hypothetical protein